LQHSIAGPVANDEKICKSGQFTDVQQDNLFSFFFFQEIDDSMSLFDWIQDSPLNDRFSEF